MPAQDLNADVAFSNAQFPPGLRALHSLMNEGVRHVWLFPCPKCGVPVLTRTRKESVLCAHCDGLPMSAETALPKRSRDEILVEINELISESWVSG